MSAHHAAHAPAARSGMSHLRLHIEDFDEAPRRAAAEPSAGCLCPRCAADPHKLRCQSDIYDEGYQAGQTQRRNADQDHAARLALDLSDALAAAQSRVNDIAEQAAEALGQTVIAMFAALLPATQSHHGPREIRAIAKAVLPTLAQAPHITIDAAPDVEDDLQAAIAELPASEQSRVELRISSRGASGALSIAWPGGALHRDPATALRNVRAVLDELGLTAFTPREEALLHG